MASAAFDPDDHTSFGSHERAFMKNDLSGIDRRPVMDTEDRAGMNALKQSRIDQ